MTSITIHGIKSISVTKTKASKQDRDDNGYCCKTLTILDNNRHKFEITLFSDYDTPENLEIKEEK